MARRFAVYAEIEKDGVKQWMNIYKDGRSWKAKQTAVEHRDSFDRYYPQPAKVVELDVETDEERLTRENKELKSDIQMLLSACYGTIDYGAIGEVRRKYSTEKEHGQMQSETTE